MNRRLRFDRRSLGLVAGNMARIPIMNLRLAIDMLRLPIRRVRLAMRTVRFAIRSVSLAIGGLRDSCKTARGQSQGDDSKAK